MGKGSSKIGGFFEERRIPHPAHSFSSDPTLDQRLPAPPSYSETWIFRPIFHLEDRSEDRDRLFIRRSRSALYSTRSSVV